MHHLKSPHRLFIDTASPASIQIVQSHFLKMLDRIHHSVHCLLLPAATTPFSHGMRGRERSRVGTLLKNAFTVTLWIRRLNSNYYAILLLCPCRTIIRHFLFGLCRILVVVFETCSGGLHCMEKSHCWWTAVFEKLPISKQDYSNNKEINDPYVLEQSNRLTAKFAFSIQMHQNIWSVFLRITLKTDVDWQCNRGMRLVEKALDHFSACWGIKQIHNLISKISLCY